MLLTLTILLFALPQAAEPATASPDELPAAGHTAQQDQNSRSSFFQTARLIRPILPQRQEEPVTYLPGQLELQPVPPANAAAPKLTDESASLTLVPQPQPPALLLPERPGPSTAQQRTWLALVVAGHGAATFDAWSTRRAITRGVGEEANPMLKPFAHSGALYVAVQASPALMDYIGRRMMTSQDGWVRRLWWLPQVAGTAVSIAAGVHNTRLVR